MVDILILLFFLDDVVSSVSVDPSRFHEATFRTIRWLDRCISSHSNPTSQNLFGIVQGGLDVNIGGLREQCVEELIKRDCPGYAIGGVAGGEDKELFWRVVAKVSFVFLCLLDRFYDYF